MQIDPSIKPHLRLMATSRFPPYPPYFFGRGVLPKRNGSTYPAIDKAKLQLYVTNTTRQAGLWKEIDRIASLGGGPSAHLCLSGGLGVTLPYLKFRSYSISISTKHMHKLSDFLLLGKVSSPRLVPDGTDMLGEAQRSTQISNKEKRRQG